MHVMLKFLVKDSVNLLHVTAYGKFAYCKKRSARVILIDCFGKCQSIIKVGGGLFVLDSFCFTLPILIVIFQAEEEPDLCKLKFQ